MTTYKWETPYDWFTSYVNSRADDPQALRSLLLNIVAQKLDSDDIQDLFQPDMDADGYFTADDEADTQEECDDDCATHAQDCDGYCDHLTEGPRHVNACEGRIGLDGGKIIGEVRNNV